MKRLLAILASMTLSISPVFAVACSTSNNQSSSVESYSTVQSLLNTIKGGGIISSDGKSIELSTLESRNVKTSNSVDGFISELGQKIANQINKKVPKQSFAYGTDFVMQYNKNLNSLEIRLPQGSSNYSLGGGNNGVIVLMITTTPTNISDVLVLDNNSLEVDSSNSSLSGLGNALYNDYGLVNNQDIKISLNNDGSYLVQGIEDNGFTGSVSFSTTVTYNGDKEMYLSSSQVKAAIVGANDSGGVSTNYLVNKISNQTLSDSFGDDVANNTNIFVTNESNETISDLYSDSISNSVIDLSTNKISKSINTNISDSNSNKDATPGDQLKSLLGILETGINAVGGSDGSNFEKASQFIDQYAPTINTISESFTWDGLNDFAKSVNKTIDENSTFDDVFGIENQYLAVSINKIISNTTADSDATIADTISFFLNSKLNDSSLELFSGEEWISVIPAALTYLRTLNDFIGLFNEDDMNLAIQAQDVTKIFSTEKTNLEYKAEMLNTKFLSNEDVKNNSYKLTNLAMILDKIGNPSSTDEKGIGLQQVMYILMGDSIENESITNSNNLVYQIFGGLKSFAVKYISSNINFNEDIVNALLSSLDGIFSSIPKIISNNDNFDELFSAISNMYSSVHDILFNSLDLLEVVWKFAKSSILDAINSKADDDHKISEDDLKSLLKDELPNILSETTKDPFKSEYSNFLGKIQNSGKDENVLNSIFDSIADLENNQSTGIGLLSKVISALTNTNFDFAASINSLKEQMSQFLEPAFGLYDLDNQSITDIVTTFAGAETANKIPEQIGQLTIAQITSKLLEISKQYNIDINASVVIEPIGKLFKALSQNVQLVTNSSTIKEEPESNNVLTALKKLKTGEVNEKSVKQVIIGTGDNAVTIDITGQQTVYDALMGYKITSTGYTVINDSILDAMESLSVLTEQVIDIALDLVKEFLNNWEVTAGLAFVIDKVIDLVKDNVISQIPTKIKNMIDFGKNSTDEEYDQKHNVSDLIDSINSTSEWTYSMVSSSSNKIVYNLIWNKKSTTYQVILGIATNGKWTITNINQK